MEQIIKPIFQIIHIHSCLASFSSKDKWMYKQVENDEIVEPGYVPCEVENKTNSQILKIESEEYETYTVIYYKNDSLYNNGLKNRGLSHIHPNQNQILNQIIEGYEKLGFSTKEPELYKKLSNERREKEKKEDIIKRKEKGCVFTGDEYNEKQDKTNLLKYIKGGFSKKVFTKELKEYCSKGIPFGYIGHNCRTIQSDKIIEKILLKTLTPQQLATWLTSGDGRHTGDWIEDRIFNEEFDWLKDYFKKKAPSIYNMVIIWNQTHHEGNMKSTSEIRKELEEKGMLLEETNI